MSSATIPAARTNPQKENRGDPDLLGGLPLECCRRGDNGRADSSFTEIDTCWLFLFQPM